MVHFSGHNVKNFQDFFCSLLKKLLYFCGVNQQKTIIMSRPIKETPILYGKDARRFLARMKEKRTETPEQREDRIAAYEAAMQMLDNF